MKRAEPQLLSYTKLANMDFGSVLSHFINLISLKSMLLLFWDISHKIGMKPDMYKV